MLIDRIWKLVQRSEFVEIGFVDENGMPNIRKTFILKDYQSVERHFISTNTSSLHVQELLKNDKACLYYSDSDTFEGVCFYGKVKIHFEKEYKEFFWHNGFEMYYPKGVEDEDYCILEFCAETAKCYGNLSKHTIEKNELSNSLLHIEDLQIKTEKNN